MSDPFDWNKAFEEIAEESRKSSEKYDAPEARAAREKKRQEKHERGVRNGWWDEDGNPLPDEYEDQDEDEEDEG